MSDQLKQQLKHCEKNLIDLEDTSDIDSGSNVESSEDIEIDGKIIIQTPVDEEVGNHLERSICNTPVTAL